jgi:hypothetical protein
LKDQGANVQLIDQAQSLTECGGSPGAEAGGSAISESACFPECPNPQPSAPSPAVPLTAVCKCGAGAHPTDEKRCARGHVLVENFLSMTTGIESSRLPSELKHLDAEVADFVTGCLVDEAEPDDVPTRRAALLNYRARIHRRIIQLDAALELRGLIDKRGRLRQGWLQQLQGLVSTARTLDAQLGLDRKAKAIDFQERLARAFHAQPRHVAQAETSLDPSDTPTTGERT